MDEQQVFDSLVEHFREIALLESTRALLEWDERTGLPAEAGGYRADQITLLSGLIHRRKTLPELSEPLQRLSESDWVADPHNPVGATIVGLLRDYRRNTQLPVELVEALSKATVLGQQAWEKARAADAWTDFAPHLQEIFSLRRQEAELLRGGGNLYDALLDEYELGASSDSLRRILGDLRDELVGLVQELSSSEDPPSGAVWQRAVPVEQQRRVSRWIAEKIGYSFQRGRLDETSHPFCTTLGPQDCRILTRYQENFFPSGFFGTLHEAGHGIYEQGLPGAWYGLPPGSFTSLGVHESQSRLWENMVGRSQAFWQWCFPHVVAECPAWRGLTSQDVYRDANLVRPSLIRVEADEVTYNLHILIRFDLEQRLLDGELSVDDAPDAWNEAYETSMGIRPPSCKDGILQDVHWSAGLIGYFPTYTLGNLYAAQLMQAAQRDIGDLNAQFSQGEFQPLLEWLRRTVHAHGSCYPPGELILRASGQELSARPLVQYLRDKLQAVYKVN